MDTSGNKDKRIKKINEAIKHTGFVANPKKSNRDLVYYVNDDTKQVHISARGTSNKHDIYSDLLFAVGQEAHDKHHTKTANRMNDLVKMTPDDYKITASGHSLGSSLLTNAMKTKQKVRDRVESLDTFNGAHSPFTKSVSKKTEKKLDDKITNHRIATDLVSASSAVNSVGKVKTYKAKDLTKPNKFIPNHLQKVFNTVTQLNDHSIDQFVENG